MSAWRRADYAMNHGTSAKEVDVSTKLERRVYDTGARVWPRLAMTAWLRDGGVILSVSTKEDSGEWWEATSIPPELIDDAIEMLTAAKSRVKP